MADEPLTIRGINWRQTFPFTNLFRAFRVAIHPSKIVLALVALVLLYIGGLLLDGLWRVNDRAVPDEIGMYEAFGREPHPGVNFSDVRDHVRKQIESDYADRLMALKIVNDRPAAEKAAHDGDYLGQIKDKISKQRDDLKDAAAKALAATPATTGEGAADGRKSAEDMYDHAVLSAYDSANEQFRAAKLIKNEGLFRHFFDYESSQLANVVIGVREGNWMGESRPIDTGLVDENPLARAFVRSDGISRGVIPSIVAFFTIAPLWMLSQHMVYFLLFGVWFLVLWAIFGGAICRIAAVHVGRDEKMSIRAALKFSVSKFLSFLFAPIIPLLIILAVGLLVTVGSLLGNIPFLGPIVIGALFFLALAAGFVMALVLLGLVGGFNLMYPTIAVEGSDSFDAISRSFSYLYARPWRLAFYTIISVVYGALTYMFVRLFITLMLILAHKFVGAGIFTHAPSTAPLWPTMWPNPNTASRLSYNIDSLSLDVGQDVGAHLVSFWVYMVIAVLGAFVISFYFSANTIIYYLMRREVDATEMDDVYLEQVDDEFAEPAPVAATETGASDAPPTNVAPSA